MESKIPQRPLSPSTLILGKYQLGRLLGRGSFAKVYYALSLSNKTPFAVKVIDKRQMAEAAMESRVLSEISAMRRLSSHPNILTIHEVLATKSKIYLVMDLAKGGDMATCLARRHAGRMSELSARRYFKQMASALQFCHASGVAHRDIKPHNLLLDEAGNVLVSDFGLAALAKDQRCEATLHTACGTPAFTAPEVVRRGGYEGEVADAWSCGIILFLFLTGSLPFDDSNLAVMYKKILRREYKFPANSTISKQAKNLIYQLLDPNPSTRMGIEAMMSHPWMKKSTSLEQLSLNSCSEGIIGIENSMNAFDIISMSSGLDLSGLFETCSSQRERRFTTVAGKGEVEEKVVEVGGKLGYGVEREKTGKIGLVKGRVRLGAEIFEVAAEVVVVKVVVGRSGFGLEDCEWNDLRVGFEQLGLVWHNDNDVSQRFLNAPDVII